jgi:hypothetical protein
MAQALVDHVTMECMGQSVNFAQINHIFMEVLGKFQFGSVGIDHVTMECMGQSVSFAQIDHITMECMGQWAGF